MFSSRTVNQAFTQVYGTCSVTISRNVFKMRPQIFQGLFRPQNLAKIAFGGMYPTFALETHLILIY